MPISMQLLSHSHADCISLSPQQNRQMETIRPSTLGARIRARREELGLTQGELAARARIRQPSLSDIEQDKTKEITARTLSALCHALGLRWQYALHGAGPLEVTGVDALTPEALVLAKWLDLLDDPRDRAVAVSAATAVISRALQKHSLPPTDSQENDAVSGTQHESTPAPSPTPPPNPAKTQKKQVARSGRKE